MKQKMQILVSIICMMIIFAAMCIMLACKAHAYEMPIRTARQDALHADADNLRALGIKDDDPMIKALSDAWWAEQEKLDIIAKVIAHEADPQWCEWEHSVAVGVVVLNRVASPYFPNTVREVVAAPGQYLPEYTYGFDATPRLCYEVAKAAIDGDHNVPADAYWQAQFPQGRDVWKVFELDTGYFSSTTYICRGILGVS